MRQKEQRSPISWACLTGNHFALTNEGDSLINAPVGDHSFEIYPGDIVILRSGPQPRDGDIVAVHMKQSNKRMIKILKHLSRDEIEFHSANKFRNYPAVAVKNSQIASYGIAVGRLTLSIGDRRRLGIP